MKAAGYGAIEPAATRAGIAVAALIYVGIYLRDFLRSALGDAIPLSALIMGLLVGIARIALTVGKNRGHRGLDSVATYALLGAVMSWALTGLNTGAVPYAAYLFSIVCAFVIFHNAPGQFMRIVLVHCAISIVIQGWEYMAGQYLFTIVDEEGLELSTDLFAGAAGVQRTKGLFPGPLSAVAFAMWIAFYYRRNLWAALALVVCAYLAAGRLGMLTGLAVLLFRVGGGAGGWWRSAVAGGVVAGVVVHLIVGASDNRLEFALMALDPTSGNNAGRIWFWTAALSEYLNYGAADALVGSFGYIKGTDIYPESDFLQLLLDHGALGLAIYLTGISRLAVIAAKRRDLEGVFVAALLVVIMNIFPLTQSLFSSTLFWLYYFDRERKWRRHRTLMRQKTRSEAMAVAGV